uniref:Putative nuclease HARBI1 n=1 Tax=Sander lucioperca TaxID=283035 RepID=A0A8D0CQB1_SANLU
MPPGEMAAVIRARRRHRPRRRAENIFATRITLFQLSEHKIIKRYRLSSHAILQLLEEIKEDIESLTQCSHSIPAVVKLLATLQILASGSFQTVIASAVGIWQSALSRVIAPALNTLLQCTSQYIHFPTTNDEITRIKQDFFNIGNFPNVIGTIDCIHIPTVPPSLQEHIYRNRKHTYSMNVQVVCDANMVITNVVAKFPVHDSFIFRNSAIYQRLGNQAFGETWLLGKHCLFYLFVWGRFTVHLTFPLDI